MSIRSLCFSRGVAAANAWVPVYMVPDKYTAILKQASLHNDGSTTSKVTINYGWTDHAAAFFLLEGDLVDNAQLDWSGWVTLNAGDTIYVNSNGSPVRYWISGALLPD